MKFRILTLAAVLSDSWWVSELRDRKNPLRDGRVLPVTVITLLLVGICAGGGYSLLSSQSCLLSPDGSIRVQTHVFDRPMGEPVHLVGVRGVAPARTQRHSL